MTVSNATDIESYEWRIVALIFNLEASEYCE